MGYIFILLVILGIGYSILGAIGEGASAVVSLDDDMTMRLVVFLVICAIAFFLLGVLFNSSLFGILGMFAIVLAVFVGLILIGKNIFRV